MKKETQPKKETQIHLRISEYEKNKLKITADRYAKGNLSAWILHAIRNAPRKFLKD